AMAPAADHRSGLARPTMLTFRRGPQGRSRVVVSTPWPPDVIMEALWVSTAVVAVAEIGDKTQLLAIVLAARFRKPLPIILGIFAATILNHAAAAGLGFLIARWLTGPIFQAVVGAAFI